MSLPVIKDSDYCLVCGCYCECADRTECEDGGCPECLCGNPDYDNDEEVLV